MGMIQFIYMNENDKKDYWKNLKTEIIHRPKQKLNLENDSYEKKVGEILDKARLEIGTEVEKLNSLTKVDEQEVLEEETILGSDEQVEEHVNRLVDTMSQEEANSAVDATIGAIRELVSIHDNISKIATSSASDIVDTVPTVEAAISPLKELRKILTDIPSVNNTRRVLGEYDSFVAVKLAKKV